MPLVRVLRIPHPQASLESAVCATDLSARVCLSDLQNRMKAPCYRGRVLTALSSVHQTLDKGLSRHQNPLLNRGRLMAQARLWVRNSAFLGWAHATLILRNHSWRHRQVVAHSLLVWLLLRLLHLARGPAWAQRVPVQLRSLLLARKQAHVVLEVTRLIQASLHPRQ